MSDQRALVVDDSKVGRLTMMKKLEAMGIRVDLVESGQQALDFLGQHRPDMIFMDHMMPDMDGFETTRRIKADPATRDIPVIIISGNDDEAFVLQARSIGALDAVSKPPAPGVLEAILRALPPVAVAPVPVPTPPATPAEAEKPGAAPMPRAAAMDQAAVHALVERLLGEAMDHVHNDLLADMGKQMETALANQRKQGQDSVAGLRQQLDQAMTGLDALRHGVAEAQVLAQRQEALEQGLERLAAEAAPAPDMESMLAAMEERMAPRLEELGGSFRAQLEDRSSRVLQEAMQAMESAHSVPGLDAEAILAAMDERMATRMAQTRNDFLAQVEERSASLEQALAKASSEQGQHLADMARRLEAMERQASGRDVDETENEALLAAVDERMENRLDTLRQVLQAKWEEQQSAFPGEAALEGIAAPLRARQEALGAEFAGLASRLAATEQAQSAQRQELAELGKALETRITEEGERLLGRFEAQQAQQTQQTQQTQQIEQEAHAASLEALRSRQETLEDGMSRLHALEHRLEALGQDELDASARRVLDQHIAQMREVVDAVLQPSYPGLDAASGLGSASLKALEAEVGELRDRLSETRMRQFVAEAVENLPPPAGAGQEAGAWNAPAPGGPGLDRVEAEVQQLKGKVKTLTLLLAVGGVALLVALGKVFLGG